MFQMPNQMITSYLQRRREDLRRLTDHLENKNFEEIRSIAHRIVGSAKNYGFPELERIAQELENLNLDDGQLKASRLVEKYRIWTTSQNDLNK